MLRIKNAMHSEKAAVDLASIMVGVIVIGIIGGIIAATVLAVIPWSQDNAAKGQLKELATAQNAYNGFTEGSTFGNVVTDDLTFNSSTLMKADSSSYCSQGTDADFISYSYSKTGKVFEATSYDSEPQLAGTPSQDADDESLQTCLTDSQGEAVSITPVASTGSQKFTGNVNFGSLVNVSYVWGTKDDVNDGTTNGGSVSSNILISPTGKVLDTLGGTGVPTLNEMFGEYPDGTPAYTSSKAFMAGNSYGIPERDEMQAELLKVKARIDNDLDTYIKNQVVPNCAMSDAACISQKLSAFDAEESSEAVLGAYPGSVQKLLVDTSASDFGNESSIPVY